MLDKHKNIDSRDDPTCRPRFVQIADEIRSQIATGDLKEHDILPSERSLSEHYGVSRMTGRRALKALETEGLVYNTDRRGRFVSPQRLKYNVCNMVSFVSAAQADDVDLKIEVVKTAQTVADNKLAALLEQPVGCAIIAYTRLFHSSDHPIFIETEYLVAERFPGFLQYDLRQSTTQILEARFGTIASTGDIVIRMRGVQPDEAQLLSLSANHAVIELEQVIRDEAGVPFCFGHQAWRGEMAEFFAHAIAAGRSPGKILRTKPNEHKRNIP